MPKDNPDQPQAKSNATQNESPPPGPQSISDSARKLTTFGALVALALASIDVSVVGTAMPKIVEELHGLELYSWVGVAYAMAAAVVIPISGKLGDMFGRRPFLLAGLAGFVISSVLGGIADGMTMLVVARTLQGVCAGVLNANIFTLIGEIYPAERRAKIMGLCFSVASVGMVAGPPFGGLITDVLSWRWVFYINVPLGVLALVTVAAMPSIRSRANWRDIDFLGVLTLTAGFVPILAGLSVASNGHGWGRAGVLIPIIAGAVVLVAFYFVETRYARQPIMPFGIFKVNQVAILTTIAFLSAFVMMGTSYFIPLLYQGVLGVSATFSGSLLIPLALAMVVVPPFTGKLLVSVPKYRVLAVVGFAAMAGGLLMLTGIAPDSNQVLPLVAMVLIGIGVGLLFPLATTVIQSAVPMEQLGVGTGLVQFSRTLAAPVAIALLGTVMTVRLSNLGATGETGTPGQLSDALSSVFLTGVVLAVVGLVIAFFLKEIPLRSAPKPPPPKKAEEVKQREGSGT
ncbi:MAG: MFS transporter [Umezawaea sp.]